MHWASFEDFLAMGGYGFYVWFSFGLTAACIAVELWALQHRQHRATTGDGA